MRNRAFLLSFPLFFMANSGIITGQIDPYQAIEWRYQCGPNGTNEEPPSCFDMYFGKNYSLYTWGSGPCINGLTVSSEASAWIGNCLLGVWIDVQSNLLEEGSLFIEVPGDPPLVEVISDYSRSEAHGINSFGVSLSYFQESYCTGHTFHEGGGVTFC